jgi:hypothetical protein
MDRLERNGPVIFSPCFGVVLMLWKRGEVTSKSYFSYWQVIGRLFTKEGSRDEREGSEG